MKKDNETFQTPVPNKVEMVDYFVPMLTILEGLKEKISKDTEIFYTKGCEVRGHSRKGFNQAIEIARRSETAILVVGDKSGLIDDCTSGETRDRADLNLPGVQEDLVKAIYKTGTPLIVVLINGRPLSVNWIVNHVPAIVEAWLPGEEGAQAIADVLFGDYNPGGKLPISFPRSVGQVPVYYNHKPSGGRSHWKGDYVEMSSKPLFPFGYGLSYTNFKYNHMDIRPNTVSWDGQVEISIEVQNIGSYKGDEVVQLYIHDELAEVTRPVKELKGFKRITLNPGEKKKITFFLSVTQLGFYNKEMHFVLEPGIIKVMIGSSSEDIRLTGKFHIIGETKEIGKIKKYFTEIKIDECT
jgi:beta-glucosidase